MTLSKSSPISLKSVKYSVWASEETHAFEATVRLDGETCEDIREDDVDYGDDEEDEWE